MLHSIAQKGLAGGSIIERWGMSYTERGGKLNAKTTTGRSRSKNWQERSKEHLSETDQPK